jgi:osmotically-inducible protein OsmY
MPIAFPRRGDAMERSPTKEETMKTIEPMVSAITLKDKVLAALKWEPSVNEAEIGIVVKDGIVTMMGTVPSWAEKVAAERAVQRVAGVRAVANDLQIQLPILKQKSDADIAAAAASAVREHVFLPDGGVRIGVDRGWVTLSGAVDWQFQKAAAETALRNLPGIVGIRNQIMIRPRAVPADVRSKITEALERSALREAERMSVDVQGARVTLRGRVHSLEEKNEAAWAAWSAPGVLEVQNLLEVT